MLQLRHGLADGATTIAPSVNPRSGLGTTVQLLRIFLATLSLVDFAEFLILRGEPEFSDGMSAIHESRDCHAPKLFHFQFEDTGSFFIVYCVR